MNTQTWFGPPRVAYRYLSSHVQYELMRIGPSLRCSAMAINHAFRDDFGPTRPTIAAPPRTPTAGPLGCRLYSPMKDSRSP